MGIKNNDGYIKIINYSLLHSFAKTCLQEIFLTTKIKEKKDENIN